MANDKMEDQAEHLEMAKALYHFKATIAKTLSFKENDHFIIYQPSTKQRNWWQVIDKEAKVGYVPSNYVVSVQVTQEFISKFIDECLAILRKESNKARGIMPSDRQELLNKLEERKEEVEKNQESKNEVGPVPVPPEFVGSPSGSASKISPPLLLHSSANVRPVQSAAIFHTETKIKIEKHEPSETYKHKRQDSKERHERQERLPLPVKPPKPQFIESNGIRRCVSQTGGQVGLSLAESKVAHSFSESKVYPPPAEKPVPPPQEFKVGLNHAECRKSASSISSTASLPSVASAVSVASVCSSEVDEPRSPNASRKNSSQERDPISEETVFNLVEQVRCHTQLSHDMSRVAVTVVLSDLERFMPNSTVLQKMLHVLQGPMCVPQPMIEQTHDAQRLKVIFSELTSCKDDAQQRSWMLHEDEDTIVEYITELTNILLHADGSICRHVISTDQYAGVLALTQYYQMEVRWNIRRPLLQALGELCSLEKSIISIFLSSVLPMELARDMKSNPRNIPKLNYSALLLTMIFSMGEPMPITHLEHLGLDFIRFIFSNIEDPPDTDADDQIPDLFITLILSYNLQFKTVNDNVLIKAISERSIAKTFTEKILLLLNREDDPARVFEHEPAPPHSVLKLFVDLFSNTSTAGLFYTNDVKVLIDIIVRQLADLSPGDQRRNQYLQLCRVVMRNSGYSEHHHRKDDLLKSFTRIFCEETEVSLKDQQLVREISNEFPQYFKS